MEIQKIKEAYPKSYKRFLEYNKKYLLAMVNSTAPEGEELSEDFAQLLTDSSVESAAEGLITYYPRALYDFFDENKVYTEVVHHHNDTWAYKIHTVGSTGNEAFASRLAAEEDAFEESFELLEKQL